MLNNEEKICWYILCSLRELSMFDNLYDSMDAWNLLIDYWGVRDE